jgi:hypothetical protein
MFAKMSEKQFALIYTSLAAVLTEPHSAHSVTGGREILLYDPSVHFTQ